MASWPICPKCEADIRELVQLPYGLEDGSMVLALSCPHCNLLLSILRRELEHQPRSRQVSLTKEFRPAVEPSALPQSGVAGSWWSPEMGMRASE